MPPRVAGLCGALLFTFVTPLTAAWIRSLRHDLQVVGPWTPRHAMFSAARANVVVTRWAVHPGLRGGVAALPVARYTRRACVRVRRLHHTSHPVTFCAPCLRTLEASRANVVAAENAVSPKLTVSLCARAAALVADLLPRSILIRRLRKQRNRMTSKAMHVCAMNTIGTNVVLAQPAMTPSNRLAIRTLASACVAQGSTRIIAGSLEHP